MIGPFSVVLSHDRIEQNELDSRLEAIYNIHKDSHAYLACQKIAPRVIVMTNAFLAQTVLLLRAEHQSFGGVDGCHNSVEGGRSGMVAEGEGGTCSNGGKVDLPRSDAGGIKPGRISLRGRLGDVSPKTGLKCSSRTASALSPVKLL